MAEEVVDQQEKKQMGIRGRRPLPRSWEFEERRHAHQGYLHNYRGHNLPHEEEAEEELCGLEAEAEEQRVAHQQIGAYSLGAAVKGPEEGQLWGLRHSG